MAITCKTRLLEAFQRAANRVPAYKTLLAEADVCANDIRSIEDFTRLPVLDKQCTFQRFGVDELCLDGQLGQLTSVLTSSGHSGVFAFGLSDLEASRSAAEKIDDVLELVFHVRSRKTLLINCLPMGVKVHTQACALAETSVRPDMSLALIRAFAPHFAQIILIGDTAFVKHMLELGQRQGLAWERYRVHVILGEEALAENARKYLERILGIENASPEKGLVVSSMGIGEVGLNLFFEVPPLVDLRKTLHENSQLREVVLGPDIWVPCLFTYDPQRVYVEFVDHDRLVLSTLDPSARIPLIRYAPGDRGGFLRLGPSLRPEMEAAGLDWTMLEQLPIVMIHGRGEYAMVADQRVYPEGIKEGIYLDPQLASLTTANFRIASEKAVATIHIQLSSGVATDEGLNERFAAAISHYVRVPLQVRCDTYETFCGGMSLDYERKFDYLRRRP